ncbi:muscarinic acetylcholine receptor gar-2-like [Oculina patagonica]
MKIQEKYFATEVVMVFLTVILTLVTIIGNGFYLAIFARFKVFRRNCTNILIASLAVVDCLNVLFNVPLFTLFFVVETNWLKGKAWAIISYSLRLEFGFLNLVSMTALMADRFFAVHLPLKYFTWKTTKKAKIAVFLMWLVCTIVVVLLAVPLFNMDLDGMPVGTSRKVIYEKERLIVGPIIVLFTIASTVLGILTCYSIYQKKKEVREHRFYYTLFFI